ncbi:MAG: polyphosphate kinase 1 [Bacteroidia bacterium]|nr:polyphosphate kinase 1 [Bacteroidia bacterium]
MKKKFIIRDISWLSFNGRVLQEAADTSNPLIERIHFLGIFSNNLDEFFRVRVATLKRMLEFGSKAELRMHLEKNPKRIMEDINQIVLLQQNEFNRIWDEIIREMKRNNVFIKTEKQLTLPQQKFVQQYFDSEVRSNIIPLMIESIPEFPNLREKSLYLAVQMSSSANAYQHKFAVIEVPTRVMNRFVLLPSHNNQTHIILLEDVIRFNLKYIFGHMDLDRFNAWIFKVTRDAEIDLDNDVSTNLIQKIEAGIKKRKRGKTVRLVYDKEIDSILLKYLFKRLNLSSKDSVIPGGRIHNFMDFMNFPDVFPKKKSHRKIITLSALKDSPRVTDVVLKKDVLLCFPYHSFDSLIDLLREAAMDANVKSIKITAYRVAPSSKVMNALINAARNGKQVTVMLELRARFHEEANLYWKTILEEEGIHVLIGIHEMKVHAKLCVIRKIVGNRSKKYGFISTGNLDENTAKIYTDFCLLTSNATIMADIERVFQYLEKPKENKNMIDECSKLITCPKNLRLDMSKLIDFEIRQAKKGKQAGMILKMNSLSDEILIDHLFEAARFGVKIRLIIRGIFCMLTDLPKLKNHVQAISIVDEYLEHSRVFIFYHGGNEKIFISSADWMVRNLDHRVEVTCPVNNIKLKKELKDILNLQWHDNVKARVLDDQLSNRYKPNTGEKKLRSQIAIMKYLSEK